MKSASIGTLLSVVSLVGVGILYLKVDDLSDQVRPLTKGRAERHAVNDLPEDPIERTAPARAVADDVPGDVPDSDKDFIRQSPREAELERRIASLEKAAKKRNRMPSFRMPKFARNVRDLAKNLKLNKTQETRIQDVVDRAKRRIEDVMKIPDETGVSPFERGKEMREKMDEARKTGKWGDMAKLAMESSQARLRTIPGRNTTYAQEVDQIKKDARDEIKGNLTPEQAKDFEGTRIDPLLGQSGVRSVMAFHTVGSGDGNGGEAVVVEGGMDITIVEEAEKDDDK